MASWKDGEGQYTWGKFSATGGYQDIYMIGGMGEGGTSDYFYIPADVLNEARSRNYGTGIHFWKEGNKVNITINLLIISTNSSQRFVTNGYYVGDSSVDYQFYANIQYKKKSTGEWVKLGDNLITTNYGGMPLFRKEGWDTQKSGYLWTTYTYDLDISDIEQFSIGVHGEGTDVYKWNYYKVENVIRQTGTLIINYINQENNERMKTQKVVEGLAVGSTVTEEAVSFIGYTVNVPIQTVTIRSGNNVINFFYRKIAQLIRPWAIRRHGIWESFTTSRTNMIKRVGGIWVRKDTSIDSNLVGRTKSNDDTGLNKSMSYIRRGGSWKIQGKIGL